MTNVEAIQHSKHGFKSRLSGAWRSHTRSFLRQSDRVRLRKAARAARKANR